jgi:pSer/pThr/pTyr-binding forkhead associated (FHA) protein
LNDKFAMPKLIFTEEPFAGRVYELTLEKTTVGRGAQNTLALHDPSVSLAHCEILVNGPEVIVRDLGSANGTFVNDVRLDDQQCQLKSNQTVRFGSVTARLELGQPSYDDTASEETAVFAMRRSMRDQRREEKKPKPASASATFESDAQAGGAMTTDHTVILTRPAPTDPTPTPKLPTKSEAPPYSPVWKMTVWVSVLLASLAFLAWLILRRK